MPADPYPFPSSLSRGYSLALRSSCSFDAALLAVAFVFLLLIEPSEETAPGESCKFKCEIFHYSQTLYLPIAIILPYLHAMSKAHWSESGRMKKTVERLAFSKFLQTRSFLRLSALRGYWLRKRALHWSAQRKQRSTRRKFLTCRTSARHLREQDRGSLNMINYVVLFICEKIIIFAL